MSNNFHVLEAAQAVADEVNRLLRGRRPSLIHQRQLRDAAQSIPANIREGMGRDPGPDRNKSYRASRGSAEETDEHLRANVSDRRMDPVVFRRLHNRIAVIVKMLNRAMEC